MTTSPPLGVSARPAGMREVAERAGVAVSSVSRVLSGHPDVSAVMRHRVLDAVAALGYEPDLLAQSLRTGETMTVGFIASDIGNPLFAEIAQGAETALRERGYSMLVANAFNDSSLSTAHVRSMHQRRVDGLLTSVSDETDDEMVEALRRGSTPVILVDRELGSFPAVLNDHAEGIDAAMEHLLALGHRRVALVNGTAKVRPSRERARAIRRVGRRHGGVSVLVRMGTFSAEHGRSATTDLLRIDDPPTAIIAGSNQILVGVLRALRELNVVVPTDLSLVTCDDLALAEFLDPPLSTISRDASELGATAARLLLSAMKGEAVHDIVLRTGFRATASCAAPPHRARLAS